MTCSTKILKTKESIKMLNCRTKGDYIMKQRKHSSRCVSRFCGLRGRGGRLYAILPSGYPTPSPDTLSPRYPTTSPIPYLPDTLPPRKDMGPEIPYPSLENKLTDVCENITFPQLLLRAVIKVARFHLYVTIDWRGS